MISLVLGVVIVFLSLFRAVISKSGLVWAREFQRLYLGLLVMGMMILPHWEIYSVILDATGILVGLHLLRADVQAQGEANE